MKSLFMALLIGSVMIASAVNAQQAAAPAAPAKTYTFSLTVEETNQVLNVLSTLPWKDANALVTKLVNSAREQDAAPPKPDATPPKKD
jgi:hypothetical protein